MGTRKIPLQIQALNIDSANASLNGTKIANQGLNNDSRQTEARNRSQYSSSHMAWWLKHQASNLRVEGSSPVAEHE
eukprot:CAMPEP_0204350514 /NCGR_PEP_ID=MMETSP0469-20131031/30400_1 /ASSEMBLY_ACC=CAM_ASM_000384 /TAXON_ID=2969 /ORGANISM="Oxyrrhis marina" /LENGTH=75 /DNA_ID=CAMNT_0051336889 /DNA_START=38 /DNA_END=262 /DNA_ORIENTATION=-